MDGADRMLVSDLDGTSRKYRLVRRAYRPFVTRYVALSKDLQQYLRGGVAEIADRVVVRHGADAADHAGFQHAPQAGDDFLAVDAELAADGIVGA